MKHIPVRRMLPTIAAWAALAFAAPSSAQYITPETANRIEAIPISTLTLTDQQFLNGDGYGRPTTIAGVLRVAQGTGRLPLVVMLGGSGGLGNNIDGWDNLFLSMGISTFAIDPFAGRGLVSTVNDQSQLGRLNMILDVYRSLEILAAHPRVDPARIAIIGFSRGGQAALYSALTRFHERWNNSGVSPVAYIPLYPNCSMAIIDDTVVADVPIRIFHGTADDWNPIQPCRDYVARLVSAGVDVTLTEFAGLHHVFDYPGAVPIDPPLAFPAAQANSCLLVEEPRGIIVNTATGQPFTYGDACVRLGTHAAYDQDATDATHAAVTDLLRDVFALP